MAVPETSMDKDEHLISFEDEIWLPWQGSKVLFKLKAILFQCRSEAHLWLSTGAPDPGHALASLLRRQRIHGSFLGGRRRLGRLRRGLAHFDVA